MNEKKHKILIVEDERALVNALVLKLEKAGFPVQAVSDGKGALGALLKDHFDLIILDLIMPEMDGFKVLEEMRDRKIKSPVFVLTNLSQKEDEAKCRQLGASEFFVKSSTPINEIVERVKSFLAK